MPSCKTLALSILSLSATSALFAHAFDTGRVDSHAPIGVMGDHTHAAGEWMLSYRYMYMDMEGMRDGTDELSDAEVLAQFPVTPTDMDMHMHMVGVMYAPSDKLTLMAMLPYIEMSMNHITRMGVEFETEASGVGDVKVSGIYELADLGNQRVLLNMGLSLPTGDIDVRDDTPAARNARLPYPMQLGSGTFDLLPGLTFLGQNEALSYGAQVRGTLRLGENDNDYRLGHMGEATAWVAYPLADWVSGSIRLRGTVSGNIEGADPALNPNMVPTADPDRHAARQIQALFGLNFFQAEGNLAGNRLAVEAGIPLHRDLDGPQLETDWTLTLGWQYAF